MRRILHNCLRCKRDTVLPKPTSTRDLPKERLSFGPYNAKRSKMTRTNKGVKKCYDVLFTCLTRAIHIELAGDRSTDDFLLALQKLAIVEPSKSFNLITEQTLLEPPIK